MTAIDPATSAQIRAADPVASTWLSANAGSGKTRVLTNRVARLLLGGVDPQNILCLTYTKAAAGEMQNRLFLQLGRWAMMGDDQLLAELHELGESGSLATADLARARRLFAMAIETPGGLKIQTIHSFCSSILRRFPLEARVSPGFSEIDERTAQRLRLDVLDDMAGSADLPLLESIFPHLNDSSLLKVTQDVIEKRDLFLPERPAQDIAKSYGINENTGSADALAAAIGPADKSVIDAIIITCKPLSDSYQKFGIRLAQIDTNKPNIDDFRYLIKELLDGTNKAKIGKFPRSNHTKVITAFAPIQDELDAWMLRIEAAYQMEFAAAARDKTLAMHRFAARFIRMYEDRKLRAGLLDYDDLIHKARDLLTNPTVAQWVLYKLDGGIDHLLVDEAQDTSPVQWNVIEALAQEFSAGQGSQPERERTIFVVGDKKQSIYSFQGADPEGFDRMRDHFEAALAEIGRPLQKLPLSYSFRSSSAILGLVDLTFSGPRSEGLEDKLFHRAFKQSLPGRVDLWPVIEPAPKPGDLDWRDPVDAKQEAHHDLRLARTIAEQIEGLIGQPLPYFDNDQKQVLARPISAGDFLILVSKRGSARSSSSLFSEIIRACKARGLPMAGADRFKLLDVIAVKDILSLLRFLALAEDDLSLAECLKSPLFGWTEQELFTLAKRRADGEYLWSRLRNSGDQKPETLEILNDLRGKSDFLRPYDLISRILIRHDGRKRLIARLGHEVTEGIDALLAKALDYEANNVPSLTGFLTWIEGDDAEVKRQVDNTGDRVRVMTVHGAKGLESPIVILPQTLAPKPYSQNAGIMESRTGVGLWYTKKEDAPMTVLDLVADSAAADAREKRRLLYVAMTRAESWLIIAGAGTYNQGDESWYDMIADGMARIGAVEHDHLTGRGLRHETGSWDGWPVTGGGAAPSAALLLGDVAPIPEISTPRTLAPSDLGGAKAIAGEYSVDTEEDALARGRLFHSLIEHLPTVPRHERPALAEALLQSHPDAAMVPEAHALAKEAVTLLDDPELAHIFADGSLSEVEVTAALPALDGARIHGAIDRLVVTEKSVLIVDYKTNRIVPDSPDAVPDGLLRQMGAYAQAMHQIYPDRVVETAILWVHTGKLMPLPAELIELSLSGAARP